MLLEKFRELKLVISKLQDIIPPRSLQLVDVRYTFILSASNSWELRCPIPTTWNYAVRFQQLYNMLYDSNCDSFSCEVPKAAKYTVRFQQLHSMLSDSNCGNFNWHVSIAAVFDVSLKRSSLCCHSLIFSFKNLQSLFFSQFFNVDGI